MDISMDSLDLIQKFWSSHSYKDLNSESFKEIAKTCVARKLNHVCLAFEDYVVGQSKIIISYRDGSLDNELISRKLTLSSEFEQWITVSKTYTPASFEIKNVGKVRFQTYADLKVVLFRVTPNR